MTETTTGELTQYDYEEYFGDGADRDARLLAGRLKEARTYAVAPTEAMLEQARGSATIAYGSRILHSLSRYAQTQVAPEGGTYVIPLEVGVFANRFFWGSGGALPYRWAVSAGTLPPGMSLIQDDPNGAPVRVGGTPTILVNGKYMVTTRKSYQDIARVTDALVARERAAR